jgi:hypothetical protein
VVGREGDVVLRVPVFGADFQGEGQGEEVVDCGDYSAAGGDCEGAILWVGGRSVVVLVGDKRRRGKGDRRGLTGGQKSSWRSTTIRAGLKSVAMVLVGG